MSRRLCLVLISAVALLCGAGGALAQMPAEQVTTRVLPPASPHWVYLLELGFPAAMTSKVSIIDGDSLNYLGMLSGEYSTTFDIPPDHHELYMIDTFYSRGIRGTRTDVVTIYDPRKLEPTGEIEIPPKRILLAPKRYFTGVTPDGRFLLVANMTPATSVSVVDLKARKFVGEIDTPGCTEVIPSDSRRFSSICSDGSLLTVDLDEQGRAASSKRSSPFFDADRDPVFEHFQLIGKRAYFVSYHGMLYEVDLSGADPRAEKPWSLVSAKEKAEAWRPGGWQLLAAHHKSGLLYVLMHQGGEWTHKKPGPEVWVFDAARHKRVDRIVLVKPGDSIFVSQDDDPRLFVATIKEATLQVYSALKGRYAGMAQEPMPPFVLFGP